MDLLQFGIRGHAPGFAEAERAQHWLLSSDGAIMLSRGSDDNQVKVRGCLAERSEKPEECHCRQARDFTSLSHGGHG